MIRASRKIYIYKRPFFNVDGHRRFDVVENLVNCDLSALPRDCCGPPSYNPIGSCRAILTLRCWVGGMMWTLLGRCGGGEGLITLWFDLGSERFQQFAVDDKVALMSLHRPTLIIFNLRRRFFKVEPTIINFVQIQQLIPNLSTIQCFRL
jgi:hypothetical protein